MKWTTTLCMAGLLAVSSLAATVKLPQGTQVDLAFDQALSSRTAKAGETVKLHVLNAVFVDGKQIIAAGAPVTGVLTKVDRRKRFGINASMQITLNPVKTMWGQSVPLQARIKGNPIGGSRGNMAAGASAGGAVALGPVGLVGGYFVVGKSVIIRVGDKLITEVTKDQILKAK